ncbi:MAG: M23 family metallopeptidase, partial [Elioraea sp.]|nr:M23 family metallopeptidase [Elioraea sp.]
AGDRFALVYEQPFRDGEPAGPPALLAVSFVNRGKRFDAVRFTRGDGTVAYFNAEGRPLRKAFLRTPVEFTRISSRFALARRHPILGRMRAHRGVDYAAPVGTPVRAAGDGRIVALGPRGGYGRTIVIDHGRRITTLYAHLSRFAPGLRLGSRVRQGQTIGFVGMTGLATGPHLHYEFRIDGVHRNPLTVPLPAAAPLVGAELQAFRRAAQPWLAQIERLGELRVADGGAGPRGRT